MSSVGVKEEYLLSGIDDLTRACIGRGIRHRAAAFRLEARGRRDKASVEPSDSYQTESGVGEPERGDRRHRQRPSRSRLSRHLDYDHISRDGSPSLFVRMVERLVKFLAGGQKSSRSYQRLMGYTRRGIVPDPVSHGISPPLQQHRVVGHQSRDNPSLWLKGNPRTTTPRLFRAPDGWR